MTNSGFYTRPRVEPKPQLHYITSVILQLINTTDRQTDRHMQLY